MNRRIRLAFCLPALAWLGLNLPAAAQPAPLGPETRVAAVETGSIFDPAAVAAGPDGGFEIAWSYLSNQPPFVLSRHYGADGRPTDAAPVELAAQASYPKVLSVTAVARGFDVLWLSEGDAGRQSHLRRHLDPRGVPTGPPLMLGGRGLSTRWVWQVRGQGFLAGWPIVKNGGTYLGFSVQHLDAAGNLAGPVSRVNSRTMAVDSRPTLTSLVGGGFVAVWDGAAATPTGNLFYSVLRARVYSPAGQPLGPDFDVDKVDPASQDTLFYPKAASAPDGGFALAWRSFDDSAQVATPFLRLYDAAGRPRSPKISGSATQWVESLAFDGEGRFLVLWADQPPNQSPTFEVQLFDADGTPEGPAAPLATAASGRFTIPTRGSVVWSGSSWIVVWHAAAGFPGPNALFVRRFAGG